MRFFFRIPKEVVKTAKTLEEKGYEAYLVGGCVRDLILGKMPNDWDITTNATPEEIQKSFPNTFYENDFGTVGVKIETEDETLKTIEVTPYRVEGIYSDKRRPDEVTFAKKIEDDLKRRDFTINAFALKLAEEKGNEWAGDVLDLFDGIKDIKNRLIRAVGEPQERFSEDALRMMRAVRISAELGFSIEEKTFHAIEKNSKLLEHIAAERIREEFIRIVMSPHPMAGIELLRDTGLLKIFMPELLDGIGMEQNSAHAYDVWEHTMRTVQHSGDKEFPLDVRLTALFHDIGKTRTRKKSEKNDQWTFYGHDVVGARMTEKILERLKFSKKMTEKIVKLVRWHMFFSDTEQISLSAVRRMVANVGKENIWDLMNVRICDRIGTGRPKESPYRLRKYRSMVEEAMRDPITVGMLEINGAKIMEITNMEPGPKIGMILHALLEEVLENPALNTDEYMQKRAIELNNLPEMELKKLGAIAKDKKEAIEQAEISKIRGKHGVK